MNLDSQQLLQSLQNYALCKKKNDKEGSDFYYMGKMKYNSFEDTTMKDKDGADVAVVNIHFDMENLVP